eukprot:c7841_g1_i1.p1 GENE.c7841_g1_i1~~c7841_g1_i1.p1  ORF type:complete len:575 (-),score=131.38 c7841_g1_i1:57-1580(-)
MHFNQLNEQTPAHKQARLDVMSSSAEYQAVLGNLAEAKSSLHEAISMAKQTGDYRMWAKCLTQLGNIILLEGNVHDALNLFVSVYLSVQSTQSTANESLTYVRHTLNGITWCLIELCHFALADELLKTTRKPDFSPCLCHWTRNKIATSILEANTAVSALSEGMTGSVWNQFHNLIAILDTLFAQWTRMLAHLNTLDPASTVAPNDPVLTKPTVLGLARMEQGHHRKTTIRLSTRRSLSGSELTDDLSSLKSADVVTARILTVKKAVKKVFRVFEQFSTNYPFSRSAFRVYEHWYNLFDGQDIQGVLDSLWSSFPSNSPDPMPREELLAHVLSLFCFNEKLAKPEKEKGEKSARNEDDEEVITDKLVSNIHYQRLQQMSETGFIASCPYFHMFVLFQHDKAIRDMPRDSATQIAAVMWHVMSETIRVFNRLTFERQPSYEDVDKLRAREFTMKDIMEFEVHPEERVECLQRLLNGRPNLDDEAVHVIKLVIKEQQFINWLTLQQKPT